jgi:hypothetical protein
MSETITVSLTLDPEKDDLKVEKGYADPDLVELILKDPACAKAVDDFRRGWEDV